MSIFREITAEEQNQRFGILRAVTSAEAMRNLEIPEIDLAMGVAKVVHILQTVENPFPAASPNIVGGILMPNPEKLGQSDLLNPSHDAGKTVIAALDHAMLLQAQNYYETPEDLATGMMSDIYSQIEAKHLLMGIANPEYAALLPEKQERIVGYANDDDEVANQIRHQATGEYHKVDRFYQGDLRGDMTGSNVPQPVKDGISRFYGYEDYRFENSMATQESVGHNINSALDQANSALLTGVTTGTPAADTAIHAVKQHLDKDLAAADPEHESRRFQQIVCAAARLLHRHESGNYVDEKAGAAIMLNDIGIQRIAANEAETGELNWPDPKRTQAIASGQWHELDATGRGQVADAMNEHRHVAAADVVAVHHSIISFNESMQRSPNERGQQTPQAKMQRATAAGMEV